MIHLLVSVLQLVFLISILQCLNAQTTPSSDEDLHQNQIPPPNLQPSEDDVKEAILLLVDQKIDQNSDEKLSTEELRDWLSVVHNRIIDDNVERQWAFYGPSVQEVHSWEGYTPETKEVLNWESFKSASYPDDYLKEGSPNHLQVQKLMQRSERRWSHADLNSDSVLTKDEFKGFIHPEEVERLQFVLVDEALEDMDSDNDTFVTLDEYFKHLTTVMEDAEKEDPNWKQVCLCCVYTWINWSSPLWQTHEAHFYEYLDKNKDSKLDRDELKDWIIPKYNKHEAEAYRLLTHADEDKDGELSKDEISQHFQHFYAVLPPEFWDQFAQEDSHTGRHDEL